MKLFIYVFSFILFTSLWVNVFGQNTIRVNVGQQLKCVNTSVIKITQHTMAQDIDIITTGTNIYDFAINSIVPHIQLQAKISRMKFNTESFGKTMDFDSDKKEDADSQIGQLAKQIIGKTFDLLIDTSGLTIKNSNEEQLPEFAKTFISNLNEIGNELFISTPKSLKQGDSWVKEISESVDNNKKTEFRIVVKNDSSLELIFNGKSTNKITKTIQGTETTMSATSTFKGEMSVDGYTGLIKKKKTEVNSIGVTQIMGQEIKFSSKQEINSDNTIL